MQTITKLRETIVPTIFSMLVTNVFEQNSLLRRFNIMEHQSSPTMFDRDIEFSGPAGIYDSTMLPSMVGHVLVTDEEHLAISMLRGILNYNVEHDSSDMVFEGETNVPSILASAPGIFTAIIMHSGTAQRLGSWKTFHDLDVFVSDICPKDVSFLVGPELFNSESFSTELSIEDDGEAERLTLNRKFSLGVNGFDIIGGPENGRSFRNAELLESASWNRTADRANIPLAFIKL